MKDKIGIVHSILVDKESFRDIALENRVSRHVIGSIVNKAKLNHKFIEELITERDEKIETRRRLAECI